MLTTDEVLRRRLSITEKPGGHSFDTFTALCGACGAEMLWIPVSFINEPQFMCTKETRMEGVNHPKGLLSA